MKSNDICTFCGKQAVTDDHIPPKCLFTKPRPTNLITVRACKTCNEGAKLDDEYFRDAILTGIDERRFPEAMALSIRKIDEMGTNPKKRGYGLTTYKSVRTVEVHTEAGIYIGDAGVRELDLDRMRRSIEKWVRGLYSHHFQERIPDGCDITIEHHQHLGPDAIEEILSRFAERPIQNIGDGAFVYAFMRVQDDPRSMWLLEFYGRHSFIVIVNHANVEESEDGPKQSDGDCPSLMASNWRRVGELA
jgi:hypothetical protein